MLTVLSAGPLTTIQDCGRPGHAAMGVGHSGAVDAASYALANRLVGNKRNAAALETTFGGLVIRSSEAVEVAVTGSTAPVVLNGRPEGRNAVLVLGRGDMLTIGPPTAGVRSYLAVRGGIEIPQVLGSRSTDTLSGIGPAVVKVGDTLAIGNQIDGHPLLDQAPTADFSSAEVTLRVILGPRNDWFGTSAIDVLQGSAWTSTNHSNRIGMRLAGPKLPRAQHGELASEGVVNGALQVPPTGRPTIFLADHPVTGGYPVIAVLRTTDIALAAQTRPGQVIRFVIDGDIGAVR
jgi:biotin-dependent carboxylase-like uncharacterized protein